MSTQVCKITDMYLCTWLNWDLLIQMEREGKGFKTSLKHPKSKVFAAVKPSSNFSARLQRIQKMKLASPVGSRYSFSLLPQKERAMPSKEAENKTCGGRRLRQLSGKYRYKQCLNNLYVLCERQFPSQPYKFSLICLATHLHIRAEGH